MEYIVVVGAKMSNKGAQSMVFQIVNEMKTRYPSKKVVAFMNHKTKLIQKMEPIYNFEIAAFQPTDILYLYGGIQSVAAKMLGVSKKNVTHLREILKNTCLAFDVSGYSLSSNWSGANSIKYLYQIAILKKYNIPTVLMPQSFGPFDYKPLFKQYINRLGKALLTYPAFIFAREDFSYRTVKKQFGLNNVSLSKDMVLLGTEVDKASVLKPGIALRTYHIKNACTAVVPNNKLVEKLSLEKALEIYQNAIDQFLKYERTVYIIQHSEADINLCIKIKEQYQDNSFVILLQENLNCLEYDLLIKQFDYIIASRYHSLVHAYKQNVPCIAIGWSEKYNSLMETLNEGQYMVDAKSFQKEALISKIALMEKNYSEERKKIMHFFECMNEDIYGKIFDKVEIKE